MHSPTQPAQVHVAPPPRCDAAVRLPARSAVTDRATELQPGDKLLCIDAGGLRRTYRPGPPVEGRVYCCREAYVDEGVAGVLLVGIRCSSLKGGLECGFLARRFRVVHRCGDTA